MAPGLEAFISFYVVSNKTALPASSVLVSTYNIGFLWVKILEVETGVKCLYIRMLSLLPFGCQRSGTTKIFDRPCVVASPSWSLRGALSAHWPRDQAP